MTRRISKKGELVVDTDSSIGKTVQDSSDDDDDPRMKNMVRNKKKSPPAPGVISPTSSDNEDNKDQAPSEGGQASDADIEASEETKFLLDKCVLTRDVLIRVHNKPREKLCGPNEVPDDPSQLPIRWLYITRRGQTSCPTKAEAVIEDYWVNPNTEHRELSEHWVGRTRFISSQDRRKKSTQMGKL